MDHVLFESDSISLVKALNSRHHDTLVLGRLTDDACALLNQFSWERFTYVYRDVNVVAHRLIICFSSLDNATLWIHNSPNIIEGWFYVLLSFQLIDFAIYKKIICYHLCGLLFYKNSLFYLISSLEFDSVVTNTFFFLTWITITLNTSGSWEVWSGE